MNEVAKEGRVRGEKKWSSEDLIDLIKKQLKTDINLDFLLEVKTRELTILSACIRDRIGELQRFKGHGKEVLLV